MTIVGRDLVDACPDPSLSHSARCNDPDKHLRQVVADVLEHGIQHVAVAVQVGVLHRFGGVEAEDPVTDAERGGEGEGGRPAEERRHR